MEVGPETTLVTGREAPTSSSQRKLTRRKIVLCLAASIDESRESVVLPDSDWSKRFRALLDVAEVRLPDDQEPARGEDVFARANARVIALARSMSDEPHAAVVWNGEGGDGPGGTRDFVERLGHHGPDASVAIIDPTPRAYEAKQVRDGSKKMLALDGGGIRGALSLGAGRFRKEAARAAWLPTLVLGDWFDYIGGTSTGAIIAAGCDGYAGRRAAHKSRRARVFSKHFLPLRLTLSPARLETGSRRSSAAALGDSELRSLLLIVLHNTATDSPYAQHHRRKHKLPTGIWSSPDRNRHSARPARARSTAAPFYFSPQELTVGSSFIFADGGLTPFNNPATDLLDGDASGVLKSWPAGKLHADRRSELARRRPSSPACRSNGDAVFNPKNVPRGS
jgi:hypothetical protein